MSDRPRDQVGQDGPEITHRLWWFWADDNSGASMSMQLTEGQGKALMDLLSGRPARGLQMEICHDAPTPYIPTSQEPDNG